MKRTMNDVHDESCAVAAASEIVATKWTPLIVWAIAEGRATAHSVREWLDARAASDSIAAARSGEYTPAR
jgi:DNA-binding HxlR family transcriptional regulator